MSLAEANNVGETISEKMSSDATVIWGARVDPRLTGILRVMLILTGVKSPQLLPRAKEEEDSQPSITRRRLADFGILTPPTQLREEIGKTRTASKFAFPTQRTSWEDRLKPIERHLTERKALREQEERKKSIEELGLRKIFRNEP
jgi:hypothetical protein